MPSSGTAGDTSPNSSVAAPGFHFEKCRHLFPGLQPASKINKNKMFSKLVPTIKHIQHKMCMQHGRYPGIYSQYSFYFEGELEDKGGYFKP